MTERDIRLRRTHVTGDHWGMTYPSFDDDALRALMQPTIDRLRESLKPTMEAASAQSSEQVSAAVATVMREQQIAVPSEDAIRNILRRYTEG